MAFPELSTLSEPMLYVVAIIVGMVPAVLWLFFWLHEDSEHREPVGILIVTFIAGMVGVLVVLPIEKLIAAAFSDSRTQIALWAASEEIIKFLAFAIIMAGSTFLDEPIEYPIYLMTAALGFAAMENGLFLVHPLSGDNMVVSILAGNLRYLGATLLHSVSSGILGISIGLAFFKPKLKFFFGCIGLIAAVALHSVFNFFIIQNNGENFLQVFGFLWVTTIIIMLLFEKLRRMSRYVSVLPARSA